MDRHFLITVRGLPRGDHPDAPAGILADAEVEVRSIGRHLGDAVTLLNKSDITRTPFVQLENTLTDLV